MVKIELDINGISFFVNTTWKQMQFRQSVIL